jgi:integrase
MSIRKRKWITQTGEEREAWLVDYRDQNGKRRLKTFRKKGDATNYTATTHIEVREGTHVPDNASVTVSKAGELWLASSRAAELERSSIDRNEQHLRLHIVPFIGREKLSKFSVPFVRAFRDRLLSEGRSDAMARAVMTSLSGILADAQERGLVVRNAVRDLRPRRKKRKARSHDDRHNGKLQIGIDIPTRDEVRALLAAAKGRWRPLLLTATFTGLRASELRGLRWDDVDLKKGELHVRQRADHWNVIGAPKSAAGERTVPLPPTVVKELREWKLICPHGGGKLGLVFPNGAGNVENHHNIVKRGLIPTMIAAGLVKPVLDEHGVAKRDDEGRSVVKARFTGLHVLRHFFASWLINRKQDGGLELPAKVVQERLGHASIVMTLDRYGHLFPRGDDTEELAAAERSLLG